MNLNIVSGKAITATAYLAAHGRQLITFSLIMFALFCYFTSAIADPTSTVGNVTIEKSLLTNTKIVIGEKDNKAQLTLPDTTTVFIGNVNPTTTFYFKQLNAYEYKFNLQFTTGAVETTQTFLFETNGGVLGADNYSWETSNEVYSFLDAKKAGYVFQVKNNPKGFVVLFTGLLPNHAYDIDPTIKTIAVTQNWITTRKRVARLYGYNNTLGAINNAATGDVNFFLSSDGGQSWSTGLSLVSDKNTAASTNGNEIAILVDDQNYFNVWFYAGNPIRIKYKRCLASTDCTNIANWSADANVATTSPVYKNANGNLGFDVDYNLSKSFVLVAALNERNDNTAGSIGQLHCNQTSDCTNSANWIRDSNVYANTEMRSLGYVSIASGTDGSLHVTLQELYADRAYKYFKKIAGGSWSAWSDVNVGMPSSTIDGVRPTIKLNKSNEPFVVFPKHVGDSFDLVELAHGGSSTVAWVVEDVNNIATTNNGTDDLLFGDLNWAYVLFPTAGGTYYVVRYDDNSTFSVPRKIANTTAGGAFGSFNGAYLDVISQNGTSYDFNSVALTAGEKNNPFSVCAGNWIQIKIPKDEVTGTNILPFTVDIFGNSRITGNSIDTNFCLPAGFAFPARLSVVDDANNYFARTYFADVNTSIQPYLLTATQGFYSTIIVQDPYSLATIADILIVGKKNIGGIATTVFSGITDDAGTLGVNWVYLSDYNVLFYYPDSSTLVFSSTIEAKSATYYVYLVLNLIDTNHVVPVNNDANYNCSSSTRYVEDINYSGSTKINIKITNGATTKYDTNFTSVDTNWASGHYEQNTTAIDTNNAVLVTITMFNADGTIRKVLHQNCFFTSSDLITELKALPNDIGTMGAMLLALLIAIMAVGGLSSTVAQGSSSTSIIGMVVLGMFCFLAWISVLFYVALCMAWFSMFLLTKRDTE